MPAPKIDLLLTEALLVLALCLAAMAAILAWLPDDPAGAAEAVRGLTLSLQP